MGATVFPYYSSETLTAPDQTQDQENFFFLEAAPDLLNVIGFH